MQTVLEVMRLVINYPEKVFEDKTGDVTLPPVSERTPQRENMNTWDYVRKLFCILGVHSILAAEGATIKYLHSKTR